MSKIETTAKEGQLIIDFDRHIVRCNRDGAALEHPLDGPEAFKLLSKLWLRSGWASKYSYSFTWFGRPIIQIPEDMVRIQEIIYKVKPDVILETGIAHGGSLILYASLCKMLGKGRVIGIDIEIRAHNRKAIEEHELFPLITMIEGGSTDKEIVDQAGSLIKEGERVLVLLDSCHTKEHVARELELYAPLVSVGSYILVADGIMQDVVGAPGSKPDWGSNNPRQAVLEFIDKHPNFQIEEADFLFNEGLVEERITYWPDGFIKRLS
ncbi:MAG: cephalosporin hydroxylase family protein [Candidatus Melainabacteria bacterium]|nr:cephalosporin hydroxylase family protein [Candidatus Melainabacteria bacterium]